VWTTKCLSPLFPQQVPPSRYNIFHCCPNHLHGKCLSAKASPSNGRVYLLIKRLLSSSDCCVVCFEIAIQQQLYSLQYLYLYQTRICNKNTTRNKVSTAPAFNLVITGYEMCNYKPRHLTHYRLFLMMNYNFQNMSNKIISFVPYFDVNLD
jgi:hypothetical protein